MAVGDLWNSLTPGEQEAFGQHRIAQLLLDLDRLVARFGAWNVDPTSRLAEDNAATSLYRPMTFELHYLVSSAIDHLDALAAALRVEGRLRPLAPFTLIRSSVESTAFALWLQAGGTLDKRVLRLLQLQWQQRTSVAAYGISFGVDPEPNNRWLENLLERTRRNRRGLGQRDFRKPIPSTTDVLIETDRGFSPALPYAGLHAWRACSGVTHGNVHFSSGLTSVQALDQPGQGGARQLRLPSIAALAMMLDPAIGYLGRTIEILESEGQPRAGRPSHGTPVRPA